ncbi:MAG: Na+/H+ antiporter NhaC family protein [Bergeyella zoohelcum]|nr:Na+/H+ antiporter NhaC family protein [Bergeyella zoohelcum]
MQNKQYNFISIIPLLVFIVTFLGFGIVNNDFYALPSPIASMAGIVVAFFIFKGNIKSKTETFLKGCGDDKILTMCIIYLLAGAFATVSKASGSVDSIVNLGLSFISPQYLAVGVFIIASFLSFSSGTSVGSIVTLAPIVIELAEKSASPLGLSGAALLCGAMFGDNLSIISDTTIASTQSMNCNMKDKFQTNFKLAIPAAVISIILFSALGFEIQDHKNIIHNNYNILLIIPYLSVIILSIFGVNVFVTLFTGTIISGIFGMYYANFSSLDLAKHTYEGFTSMTEIFLLSLLTGGLGALVEKAGGIEFLLNNISKLIKGSKTALLGIGGLVGISNLCVANNTIAILISGKISKKIADEHHISPKIGASVLDIFACYIQGIIPYGAQILLLISLSDFKIKYSELLQNAFYLHFLAIITIIYIITKKRNS